MSDLLTRLRKEQRLKESMDGIEDSAEVAQLVGDAADEIARLQRALAERDAEKAQLRMVIESHVENLRRLDRELAEAKEYIASYRESASEELGTLMRDLAAEREKFDQATASVAGLLMKLQAEREAHAQTKRERDEARRERGELQLALANEREYIAAAIAAVPVMATKGSLADYIREVRAERDEAQAQLDLARNQISELDRIECERDTLRAFLREAQTLDWGDRDPHWGGEYGLDALAWLNRLDAMLKEE